jgi:Signal transduction histidine kinase
MKSLSARLVLSHLLVALAGAVTTFLVVRALAPALFDASLRGNPNPGSGRFGGGQGQALRDQFAAAVDSSLLIGALIGAAAATIFGILLAYRIGRPLAALRRATRDIADGQYHSRVAVPRETELAGLATDVNTLGAALAETEARRLRLLGEVAHELRTPLTVIDGYVEGMIDQVLPTTPANLAQISDEVRRLRRLGDDLSILSRAEEGRLVLNPSRVDLREVAARAAERLRPQAQDAGVELIIEPGDVPLPADADADRLAQAITNVVGNALRATPGDGTVRLSCRRQDQLGLIEVSDTGVGIAEADLPRIFERFYRVGPRAGGDTGSGIGLTISRSILAGHGGSLTASSPGLGGGAVFTLGLPLA